jgi:hypothetical protein
MLGRKRELIFIVSGLIAVNVLLCWLLVGRWKEYRHSIQWLSRGVAPQRALASATGSKQTGQPSSFVEIVDRNVFSPLRGSAPAQAQEEAKAPRLPVLFGTMNLGSGRFALMSPGDQSPPLSKRVLPGEEIGGFKLVSIGTSNVVVEWQNKRTRLEITAPAPVPRTPGVIERTANVRTGAGATPSSAPGAAAVVVPETRLRASATGRTGQPGAPPDVPVGTVVGGKRKVLVPSPFGPVVQWEDVNATGSQTPPQPGAPNKP